MASPMPFPPPGDWNPNNGQTMQRNNEVDESGVQVRPMGLKVHYTFDKEAKVNCLARLSHTLHVQTVPLDDKNSIGIVDLRSCLLAVTECSPELASQGNDTNTDFTIYSLDYSEPDTPLVGQGMLSWALDTIRGDWAAQPPKMVTGRVTKNLLAVFGGGNRETLEVKLRFTTCPRVQKPEPTQDMQLARPTESLVTPSGAAEWNSFLQSNPQIGHSAHVSRVASPALSQGPSAPEVQRVAPTPVDPATAPTQPTSRPSSRSGRRRAPTGRPRGRPRKKPAEGNTSGYEDGTEGEDSGPAKKKTKTATNTTKETNQPNQSNQSKEIKTTKTVKTTKPEKMAPNPFTSGPDSLRVTASTASSLRNFRPVGSTSEGVSGSHLQEVPRAPTPVPEGGPLNMPPRGGPKGPKPRRESSMRQEMSANLSNQLPPRPARALSPSQEDHRSPESAIETPAYSEDSPQDIRSSPPVPRNASFMQSSPPMSSPILPPMPAPVQDSTFTDDIDDLFDEPILQPVKESRIQGRPPVKVIESVDSTGIPTQVFRIDGPDGQDLVHIQNYNTPHPTSGPVGPPHMEPSLPLPKPRKNHVRPQTARNPPPARPQRLSPPTPPPTTDAPEKMGSPVPVQPPCAAEVPQPQAEPQTQPGDGLDEPLLQLVRATSGLEPMPSTETNQIPQGTLPPREPVSNPVKPQPRTSRQLNRSQSAGILSLPSVPASEPVGPSTLSESHLTEPIRASTEIPACLRRSKSIIMHLPVPASDPIGPVESLEHLAMPTLPDGSFPQSDALGMPSSPPYKYKKNMVKKHAIKQKLEMAILNGEMPPFCANCGAIETPTWRKIFVQELEGVPQYVEYSDKPGQITAIEITKRDEQNVPLAYRLVKKSLGLKDIRDAWTEQLLCNPCGIWIAKYRIHRPQDKWDNAFGPLGQSRRKRGSSTNPNPTSSKAKKARTKSISYPNFTSEAYPTTDPVGPVEPSSPKQSGPIVPTKEQRGDVVMGNTLGPPSFDGLPNHDGNRSNPGSTHSRSSRGLGTAESPIEMDIDDDLGNTRRLLFSSPQKDPAPKTLGEIDANIVKVTESRQDKEIAVEKENVAAEARSEKQSEQDALEALFHSPARPSTPSPKSKAKTRSERQSEQDALEALFHSPARPSTPPPKSRAEAHTTPFKTPTRPTPSHRPITRSVSRSIRSVRGMMSPSQQALLQKTPTKTPRSAGLRRSPRLNVENLFDTPTCRTITQLLSEPNFDLDNTQFDFSSLPNMEVTQSTIVEFGNFLSTDGIMPSSPPRDGALAFGYNGSDDVFAEWGMEQRATAKEAVTVKEAKE